VNSVLREAVISQVAVQGFSLSETPGGMSDHLPFQMLGIPAITIGQLAMDRIHTPNDRAEFLDISEIERIAQMLADFVLSSGTVMYASGEISTMADTEDLDMIFHLGMEMVGSLAYDMAYQFEYGDGRFAIITGWRTLVSLDEVREYYPGIALPEHVGGYEFQDFTSFGSYNRVLTGPGRFEVIRGLHGELLPLNEIIPRDLFLNRFTASYVSSAGDRLELTVSTILMHSDFLCGVHVQCTLLAAYPDIHFVGYYDDHGVRWYYTAIYLPETQVLEVRVSITDVDRYTDDGGYRYFAPRYLYLEVLAELVDALDLPDLIERYDWSLTQLDERQEFWIPRSW
jgi:hypothetical protein